MFVAASWHAATTPFNLDVLALFRLANPSMAGTESSPPNYLIPSDRPRRNESPAEVQEAAWREATLQPRSRWDLVTTWGPAEPLQWATVVALVDSASEKNKARSG